MSAPSIGEMRLRMTLCAAMDSLDDSGASTRSYVAIGDLWVKLAAPSADARFVAARQEQVVEWIAQIRWRSDVASEMRFVTGSRELRVKSAYDPDGRRRFLLCHCEEIA